MAFSQDGKYIIAAGHNICLLDAEYMSDVSILCIEQYSSRNSSIAISSNGEFMIDGRMFKANTNEIAEMFTQKHNYWSSDSVRLKVVQVFDGIGSPMTFSPDGKRLISSSGGKIVVWDTEMGHEVLILKHTFSISSLTFSSDGRQIIAGSSNGRIVWNSADENSVQDPNGGQEIFVAAKKGDLEKIKSLLTKNPNLANFREKSDLGRTPLFLAHSRDIAELLIANGADVNAKDKYGKTPLFYASFFHNKELTKLLVAKGASTNTNEDENSPSLHMDTKNKEDINDSNIPFHQAAKDKMRNEI